MKVPVGSLGITPLRVNFSHKDYISTSLVTLEREIGLREVEIVPETAHLAAIQASVYDPKARNSPVPGAEVVLRAGLGNNTGPVLARLVTSLTGTALFLHIPLGTYTVSTNLTSVSSDIAVNSPNTTFPVVLPLYPPLLAPEQVTFMLSWPDSGVDLDLRADFFLRPEHICNVSYLNKQCGGAKLTSELENAFAGIEILTLSQVSASKYAIFVRKKDAEQSFSGAIMRVFAGEKPTLLSTLYAPSTPGSLWSSYCLQGLSGLSGLYALNTVQIYTENHNPCGLGEAETWDWKAQPSTVPLQTKGMELQGKYVFRPRV